MGFDFAELAEVDSCTALIMAVAGGVVVGHYALMNTDSEYLRYNEIAVRMVALAGDTTNVTQVICVGRDVLQEDIPNSQTWTDVMTALLPAAPLALVVPPNYAVDVFVHPTLSALSIRRCRRMEDVSLTFTACLSKITHNVVLN